MRILAHVHGYPPVHNAGAEWMLHSILRFMAEQGHDCKVYSVRNTVPQELDGVQIVGRVSPRKLDLLYGSSDVVITHLDRTPAAMQLAHRHRRPLVHLVHNDKQLAFNKVTERYCDLAVMNSVWLRDAVRWPGETIIVRPPVDYRYFPIQDDGDRVTLINLNEAKGGELFWHLAEALPDVKFLGVRGAYGEQIVPRQIPENVDVIDNTPNVLHDVYFRTRVLLVPSSYESWGRVAIEAASCGLPVIAHPTPGLRESLGSAGIFVHRNDPNGWVKEILRLLNPADYEKASKKSRKRAKALDPTRELRALESRLLQLGASTIAGMGARPCPICHADHATCGGPSEVREEMIMVDRRGKKPGKLKKYRVGNTVMKLSDFRAREMGVQDQCLEPDEPQVAVAATNDGDASSTTEASNKARSTSKNRRRRVQAPK